MKILVCGGRNYKGYANLAMTLDQIFAAPGKFGIDHKIHPCNLIIIQGGADGADTMAALWAKSKNVHYAEVPALWGSYGQSAGPNRNEAMLLLEPDLVIAFPGGKGTANMVKIAKERNIQVYEVKV